MITTEVALNFETMAPGGPYTVIAADNQGLAGYTQSTAQVSIAINNVNEQMRGRDPGHVGQRECRRRHRGRHRHPGDRPGQRVPRLRPAALLFRLGRQSLVVGRPLPDQRDDGRDHHRGRAQLRDDGARPSLHRGRRRQSGPGRLHPVRTQTVSIAINNVNEQNSLGAIPAMSVNENVGVGTVVGTVTQATDQDSSANAFGQQRYYFGRATATSCRRTAATRSTPSPG